MHLPLDLGTAYDISQHFPSWREFLPNFSISHYLSPPPGVHQRRVAVVAGQGAPD